MENDDGEEVDRRLVTVTDAEVRQRLRLGEDSGWEFKRIEFSGDRPTGPRREDLADEMAAFANASGGVLLCGVSDGGRIQGMSREQMAALDRLLVEVSTDAVDPPLRIDVHHRELDGKAFVLAHVSRGDAVHERGGRAFIRVGASKRRLGGDERLRLAQRRAQSRYLWFDRQIVPQTGYETLNERLWEPLLSVSGAARPRRGLMNLRLLASDEAAVDRATVAGVLLCTDSPHEWLPQGDHRGHALPWRGPGLRPVRRAGDCGAASRSDRRRYEVRGPQHACLGAQDAFAGECATVQQGCGVRGRGQRGRAP